MPISNEDLRMMQERVSNAKKRGVSGSPQPLGRAGSPKEGQDSGKPKNAPTAFTGKESELHAQIEAELIRRRWFYVHSRCDRASTQQAGVPDFIIAASPCIEGEHFKYATTYWIEVKKKGGKLSKEQNITRHILLALGHRYATVFSFEEFLSVINP